MLFRSACASAVCSRCSIVLNLLDGPVVCDLGSGIVWNRFRVLCWFLAYRPGEVPMVVRLIGLVSGGPRGMGLFTCF